MSLETAKSAVEQLMLGQPQDERLRHVHFMGGEPLMAFHLIRDLCEWVWAGEWKERITFFLTTNGTLLTDEMRQWFFAHRKQITAALSYDGRHAQQINRGGASLELEFFRKTWPEQPFKLTIAEAPVAYLAEDVIELCDNGVNFTASFEMGAKPWRESAVTQFRRQIEMLTDYYCVHPERDMLKDFGIRLPAVFMRNHDAMLCGLGGDFYALDSDARTYACHMLSSLTLSEDQLRGLQYDFLSHKPNHSVPTCHFCVLDPLCPICYGMSYKKFGTPFQREENICKLFQIEAMAMCSYVIRSTTAKKCLTADDRLRADAAAQIISHFPALETYQL